MTNEIDTRQVESNIEFLSKSIFMILSVCSIIEIVLFPSIDGLICISFCFWGILILKLTILDINNLLYYPVSTIAISMYVIFFLVLPMPATLIEFKPVTYNLRNPFETFANIVLLESLLIFSHWIYMSLAKKKNFIRDLLLKTPVYEKITSSELWFLIIMGTIMYIYIIIAIGLYDEESNNTTRRLPAYLYVLNLLFSGFQYIVFLFLFRQFDIIKNDTYKIQYIPITLLLVLLFIVGIATNMRTNAIAPISVGFFLFCVYWIFYLNPKSFKPRHALVALFAVWFLGGFFMNISEAMVSVRHQRNGLSGQKVLEMTFSELKNKSQEAIRRNISSNTYSEEYLSNDILQRFCSVKILDETLYRAHQLGYNNNRINEHLKNTLYSYVPRFLQKTFRINVKELHASLTDVLAYASGSTSQLGGIKIGTLQGLGLALYGWWYIPIIFLLYIVLFYLMDSLMYYENGKMKFSWIFISHIVTFVYWFSDRHFYEWEYRFLMRGFVEMIFFSCVTIWIVKMIPFIKH